jgi:hypothetical protein
MEKWGLREGDPRYGFEYMLDHTAHRPYVFRILMPVLINGIYESAPEAARSTLHQLFERYPKVKKRYFRGAPTTLWTPEFSLKYHIAYGLIFLALFGAMLVLRSLTRIVTPGTASMADVGPILFSTLLPLSFVNGGYMYDFPELFFLALAYHLAANRMFWSLLPVVCLAAINKESNVLTPILVFPLLSNALGTKRALCVAAGLAVPAAALSTLIKYSFRANPGVNLEYHLPDNLSTWVDPASYVQFVDFYAPFIPFPSGMNFILVVVVGWMVFSSWSQQPLVVRRLLVVALAVNVPLFLLFAFRHEMRNLSLTFVPFYLSACCTLVAAYAARRDAQVAGLD